MLQFCHYYDNTHMQLNLDFNDCKDDNFPLKNCIFLIFAENIVGTHNLCLGIHV